MPRTNGASPYEDKAAQTVDEYFACGLVPEDVVDDVSAHLANDDPLEALEEILRARKGGPRT